MLIVAMRGLQPAAIQTSPPVAQPVQAEPVAVAEPKPASPPKERVPKTKADVRSFISGDAVLQPKKRRKKEPPEPVVQKVVVTPVAEDSDEDDESEEEEEFTVERIYAQRQMEVHKLHGSRGAEAGAAGDQEVSDQMGKLC